jgi:hypothetical protein
MIFQFYILSHLWQVLADFGSFSHTDSHTNSLPILCLLYLLPIPLITFHPLPLDRPLKLIFRSYEETKCEIGEQAGGYNLYE